MESNPVVKCGESTVHLFDEKTPLCEVAHEALQPSLLVICQVGVQKGHGPLDETFERARAALTRSEWLSLKHCSGGAVLDCAMEAPSDFVNLYVDRSAKPKSARHYLIGSMSYPNSTRESMRRACEKDRAVTLGEYCDSGLRKNLLEAALLNAKACLQKYAEGLGLATSIAPRAPEAPSGALPVPNLDSVIATGGTARVDGCRLACYRNFAVVSGDSKRCARVEPGGVQELTLAARQKDLFVPSTMASACKAYSVSKDRVLCGSLRGSDGKFVRDVTKLRCFAPSDLWIGPRKK